MDSNMLGPNFSRSIGHVQRLNPKLREGHVRFGGFEAKIQIVESKPKKPHMPHARIYQISEKTGKKWEIGAGWWVENRVQPKDADPKNPKMHESFRIIDPAIQGYLLYFNVGPDPDQDDEDVQSLIWNVPRDATANQGMAA